MKTAILQEEFLDYFDMGYITLKTEDGSLTLKKIVPIQSLCTP